MNGTLNPFSVYEYPFHFSDWMFVERMEHFSERVALFNDLSDKLTLVEEFRDYRYTRTLKNYSTQYQAEQINYFFHKFPKLGMKHGMDINPIVLKNYIEFLSNNVDVFRMKKIGVVNYKRQKGIGLSYLLSCISSFDIYIIQHLNPSKAYKYLRLTGYIRKTLFPIVKLIDKGLRKLGIFS